MTGAPPGAAQARNWPGSTGAMACTLCLGLLLGLVFFPPWAHAAQLALGYVDWQADPRYRDSHTEQRYPQAPWGRPLAAAQMALDEARFALQAQNLRAQMEHQRLQQSTDLAPLLEQWRQQNRRFVLVDVPGEWLHKLEIPAGMTLLNISAEDQALRQSQCQPAVLHVIPSARQRSDALAQHLLSRRWRKILVLHAQTDHSLLQQWQATAQRYGLKTVATRVFEYGNDPRRREFNNVELLTSGKDHDVVMVWDAGGEFARRTPYATQHPRPVAGSAGLTARAWHPRWERYGAKQLNNRLHEALDRPATDVDWAAWMATKAVLEASQRSPTPDFAARDQFLRSQEIYLDGFKGFRLGFRPWSGQLRQPLLLATSDWVISSAPLEGFAHPRNNLDTLGTADNEGGCQ